MTERGSHHEVTPQTPRVIPMEFIEAYKEHLVVLPEEDRIAETVDMARGKVITAESVVDDYREENEYGKKYFAAELEVARDLLSMKGKNNPTRDELVREAIDSYREATLQARERQSPTTT